MLQRKGARAAIMEAALGCAEAGHWESTSLQELRQRAGVSNGSLFHHFPTRQDLTASVVAAGLDDHQQVILEGLGDDAEEGVTGAVRRHLRWIEDNSAIAHLLLGMPPEVLRKSVSEPVLEANRRFFRAVGDWLGEHGWSGRPELTVMVALWIGPAQECSRYWLAAADAPSLSVLADDLADGAWSALHPLLGRGTASLRSSSAPR